MGSNADKNSFKEWVLYTSAATVVLTGIFYLLYYNNAIVNYVFGIGGIWMTIIGLGIGIWQIAKLRNEREVIQRTRIKSRLEYVIKRNLTDIQEDFTRINPDEDAIKKFINRLNKIRHDFYEIEAEHNSEIDCNKCHDTINKIINNLNNILNSQNKETALGSFNRQRYIQDLADFIKEVIELGSKLQID